MSYEIETFTPKGWQCPVCGRVYSPTTVMCLYCENSPTTTSTTTSAPEYFPEYLKELEKADKTAEYEKRIKELERQLQEITKRRMDAGAFD